MSESDTTEKEMPYCWMTRVSDKDELSSVRQHMKGTDPKIREKYGQGHEAFDGEETIIVTWTVESTNTNN